MRWRLSVAARTIGGMMRVTFLGSGSGGNCTLVGYGATSILVDCGFSAREVTTRLRALGEDPDAVGAVVVTHEHSDHSRGLRVFAKRTGVPLMASDGTAKAVNSEAHGPIEHERLRAGEPVRIGEIVVTPFSVSHDAREPLGFVFAAPDGTRLGYASDTGVMSPQAAEALAGCDHLALEANHDIDMLASGPYPLFLKRRISSDIGHLSNRSSADALESLCSDRLRQVFAIHISRTNNTPARAVAALRDRLAAIGVDVPVTAVGQDVGLCFPDRQASLF
jgi:phosphoribosyl 1,2-cyclic phosphodiesterase